MPLNGSALGTPAELVSHFAQCPKYPSLCNSPDHRAKLSPLSPTVGSCGGSLHPGFCRHCCFYTVPFVILWGDFWLLSSSAFSVPLIALPLWGHWFVCFVGLCIYLFFLQLASSIFEGNDFVKYFNMSPGDKASQSLKPRPGWILHPGQPLSQPFSPEGPLCLSSVSPACSLLLWVWFLCSILQ